MARLPTYETGKLPSARAGAVRTYPYGYETGTGLKMLGRGLGIAAETSFQIDKREGISQFATARNLTSTNIREMAFEMEQNSNPDEYDAIAQKWFNQINKNRPSNEKGALLFDKWIEESKRSWELDVEDAKKGKKIQIAQGAYITNHTAAIKNMDVAEVKRLAIEAGKTGVITPAQKAKDIATAEHDIEMDRANVMARTAPEVLLANIDGELFDTLDAKERLDAKDRAKTQLKHLQTEAELKQKQINDAIGGEFLKLLINKLDPTKPQLTFDMINESELSFDAKDDWLTKLRVFDNYSEGELKEAFSDQGPVLAEIYERIATNTITDKEIRNMVGKGLSPTTAKSIIEDRGIYQLPEYKETDQMFKRIFGWSPELGFADDLSAFLYEKTRRDWKKRIKVQKATGEEIEEIGRTIARPHFIEHLKATMPIDTDIPRMVELALGEPEEVARIEKEVSPVLPEITKPKETKETKLPSPKTKEEYDALLIGTTYLAPDGSKRVKK